MFYFYLDLMVQTVRGNAGHFGLLSLIVRLLKVIDLEKMRSTILIQKIISRNV